MYPNIARQQHSQNETSPAEGPVTIKFWNGCSRQSTVSEIRRDIQLKPGSSKQVPLLILEHGTGSVPLIPLIPSHGPSGLIPKGRKTTPKKNKVTRVMILIIVSQYSTSPYRLTFKK